MSNQLLYTPCVSAFLKCKRAYKSRSLNAEYLCVSSASLRSTVPTHLLYPLSDVNDILF